MAQYLVLLYETEVEEMTPELETEYAKHWTFIEANGASVVTGDALRPTSTATSLRQDGRGGWTVTDGPFVETKEALGGYYLLEAADLDAVIAMARQIPAPLGGMEIRPIWDIAAERRAAQGEP